MKKQIIGVVLFSLIAGAQNSQEGPASKTVIHLNYERPELKPDELIVFGECCINPYSHEIKIPGELNMGSGDALDVLVGSENVYFSNQLMYETLLSTKISPFQIQTLLLAAGARNDITRNGVKGQTIYVDVQWQDENGRVYQEPIESFIVDRTRANRSPSRIPFNFVGSEIDDGEMIAQSTGIIASLQKGKYPCVLDCPISGISRPEEGSVAEQSELRPNLHRKHPVSGARIDIILRVIP